MSGKHDRASELRAIADGRLLLNVRNGVTVSRSMLAMIADEFEAMSTALAAKDAELAAERAALRLAADRADRAEARLAEARKALGLMLREHDVLSGNFGDVMDPKHGRPDRWPTAAEAARRALEAQGGENNG